MDVTAYFDGFHGDTNLTLIYGGENKSLTKELSKIKKITQEALYEAISICKPGVPFNKIGLAIQKFAQKHNVHVC